VRTVFADTAYFIALLLPRDDLRQRAIAFDDAAPGLRIFTTDGVLMELLAHVASRGSNSRAAALRLIDLLRNTPHVTIVRMTPELFDAGLELYRQRPDKAYSLVDCMSMVVCQQEGIDEVLTHDHHFAQEGFTVLL
jgi:predicted nucleic acid-binding protein